MRVKVGFVATLLSLSGFLNLVQGADPGKPFYETDFKADPDEDIWTPTRTSLTPKGKNRFLGEIDWNHRIVAKFSELPKHRYLRVQCDLLILKTMDGDNAFADNPDGFSIRVEGGPLLLCSTFSNPKKVPEAGERTSRQSFPDEHLSSQHKAGTGAFKSPTSDSVDRPKTTAKGSTALI